MQLFLIVGVLLILLLDPAADSSVTTEMQTQMASFLGTDGAVLVVTDETLLQVPAVP